MQQVSSPLRIALVAIAVLGAVWFVALRPKTSSSVDAPLPTAPGVQGLARSVDSAKGATDAANASAERSEQAVANAGGDATATTNTRTSTGAKAGSTAATPATPAVSVAPSVALVSALDAGKVVILVFRSGSADSTAVARAVRSVGRQRKKVVVRIAKITDVGLYEAFTRSTAVAQAPTTIVMAPSRRAQVIVGYTTAGEVSQAVTDVRKAVAKTSGKTA